MNAAEQTARIKILNAMGLGPLWLSRYASEEATPVVATLADRCNSGGPTPVFNASGV